MRSILRLVASVVILLVVLAVVVIAVSNRLGGDAGSWLMVIIPVAAAMAFYLQVLKNW